MKTKLIAILIALSATTFFFSACGNAGNTPGTPDELGLHNRPYPLVLKKEKGYCIDVIAKDGPFMGKTDDKDHLYVYFLQNQDGNCEVLKISTDLEVKGAYIIRRGIGPGEAQNPRIYGGDKNSIIVWDAPAHKYIRFDTDFKLLDEYRLDKQMGVFMYSGAKYIPEHNMVLDGFQQNNNYYDCFLRIFTLEITENKKIKTSRLWETFMKTHRKDNDKFIDGKTMNFGYFFDHVYILEKNIYRLIKMDLKGNIIKDKKIGFKERSFSQSQRKKWIDKFYTKSAYGRRRFDFPEELFPASWLIQIGDGIAVGRCEGYEPDIKAPVSADYFDKDLNYLGKIELPNFYKWNHPYSGQSFADINLYSKDGKLYFLETRDDDDYWIVRYNIEVKKG